MARCGYNEQKWDIHEVLVVSCAFNRIYGYVESKGGRKRWTSEEMLRLAFTTTDLNNDKEPELVPLPCDELEAQQIVDHYSYLIMDAIMGTLDESNMQLYEITHTGIVYETDFPIIAQLPSVFKKESVSRKITTMIKQTSNGFVGNEGERVLLSVKMLNVAYSAKLNCFVHEAITKTNGRYVTFFSPDKLASEANECSILGIVKKHKCHNSHDVLETQLSSVRIVDFRQ